MEYVITRLVSHCIRLRVFEGELRLKLFEERVWGSLRVKRLMRMRKLLHNLCCSQNTIGVMKSRRINWVGYVAHMGDTRNS